jgi:hypothetical protein
MLPVGISSSLNLSKQWEQCSSLIVRVRYRDAQGEIRKQFGSLLENNDGELLLGVGNHRPVFYWSASGRNSIVGVEAFDLNSIANILHESSLLIQADTYYKPPWELS